MPREVSVTLYEFAELAPAGKRRALRDRAKHNRRTLDQDEVHRELVDHADRRYGIDMVSRGSSPWLHWQLSSMQGDGVWFDGYLNLDRFCQADETPADPAAAATHAARRALAERVSRLVAMDCDVSVSCTHSTYYGFRIEPSIEAPVRDADSFARRALRAYRAQHPARDADDQGMWTAAWIGLKAFRIDPDQGKTAAPDWTPYLIWCDWVEDRGGTLTWERDPAAPDFYPKFEAELNDLRRALRAYLEAAARGLAEFGYAEIEYRCESEERLTAELAELGAAFHADGARAEARLTG